MMEPSGGPEQLPCSEVALLLEKKITEEILTAEEQKAVDHHLNCCEPCREFVKVTSSFPLLAEELSSKEEIDSAIRGVMKDVRPLVTEDHRKTVWRTGYALAASIAVVTVIGVLLLSLLYNEAPVTSAAFQCSPAEPNELVPGVFMTYCDDREPGAIIENGGEVRVTVRHGTVGLLIDPDRRNKRRVTVETPVGEVRVKGTVFTVHIDRDITHIEVFRGVVEVVPATRDAVTLDVPAGHGADLGRHRIYKLSEPKTDVLRLKLLAKEGGKALEGDETTGKLSLRETPISSESAELSKPAKLADPTEAVAEGSPHGTDRAFRRAAAGTSIDALIQNAQSCLIDHDWGCAASQYKEVLRRYSGSPESMAVLISLAKIELRHLNAPKEALDHYKSYQRHAPNGPLAEEALFGIAAAYRRLGMVDKEETTLRLFVHRYPKSSMMEKARSRLEKLGGSQ